MQPPRTPNKSYPVPSFLTPTTLFSPHALKISLNNESAHYCPNGLTKGGPKLPGKKKAVKASIGPDHPCYQLYLSHNCICVHILYWSCVESLECTFTILCT